MIEEEAQRRARLQALKDAGVDPYPAHANRTHTISDILSQFEEIQNSNETVTAVGRIKTIRKHGGLTFLHLEDGSGTIQFALKKDSIGEEAYTFFHETMDMGDFLEASGTAFVTKKGENSIDISEYKLLTKTLLPMPEKWHGLSDVETRYRQRYLDLIANPQVRSIFKTRATILTTIRNFLDKKGFLEVETPVLQTVPGGANAKPFVTHHNALHADLYLRIAPELFLKRLIVGGYEAVYEVSRCFRNEGIDHAHNPEFTQVEAYIAYMDYNQLMDLMQDMLVEIIEAIGLDPKAVPFQGHTLDFSSIPRQTYREALLTHASIDVDTLKTREDALAAAKEKGVSVDEAKDSKATIIDKIYKETTRPNIIQPTFLIDYPAELSPLAKRKPDNPNVVEMFQLVYGAGVENVKAFTELNDPIDQEERFAEQSKARESGDEEAQFSDDDYVVALKHGMPPTAGFGIGIDRLTATLVDSHNLKEVILFPTLKPEEE